jgi:DNA-binding transcriptional regulator YdaS (Cro superfamily)
MSPQDALKVAIRVLGSQTAVAAAAGPDIGTAHVYHWLKPTSGGVPARYCPGIERATREKGETVFCEQLCPTTDWAAIRAETGPKPAKRVRTKPADGEVSAAVIVSAHPESCDLALIGAACLLAGEPRDERPSGFVFNKARRSDKPNNGGR